MNGSWHIYHPGERWQAPARDMRIVIETGEWVAVAFRVHDAEFVRAADVERLTPVGQLGPDLLGALFDADEALDLIEREGVTHVDGFETHLKLLTATPASCGRTVTCASSGATRT